MTDPTTPRVAYTRRHSAAQTYPVGFDPTTRTALASLKTALRLSSGRLPSVPALVRLAVRNLAESVNRVDANRLDDYRDQLSRLMRESA